MLVAGLLDLSSHMERQEKLSRVIVEHLQHIARGRPVVNHLEPAHLAPAGIKKGVKAMTVGIGTILRKERTAQTNYR